MQPRICLAVMGVDQHENGVVAVGRILREAQMHARYLGKLLSPAQVVEGALDDGAQVIGVSCHSWEYLTLVPELMAQLRSRGLDIPVVIGGSVITPKDAEAMKATGVAEVFRAGARDQEIVDAMRRLTASASN